MSARRGAGGSAGNVPSPLEVMEQMIRQNAAASGEAIPGHVQGIDLLRHNMLQSSMFRALSAEQRAEAERDFTPEQMMRAMEAMIEGGGDGSEDGEDGETLAETFQAKMADLSPEERQRMATLGGLAKNKQLVISYSEAFIADIKNSRATPDRLAWTHNCHPFVSYATKAVLDTPRLFVWLYHGGPREIVRLFNVLYRKLQFSPREFEEAMYPSASVFDPPLQSGDDDGDRQKAVRRARACGTAYRMQFIKEMSAEGSTYVAPNKMFFRETGVSASPHCWTSRALQTLLWFALGTTWCLHRTWAK
jgi:hypothetical protein